MKDKENRDDKAVKSGVYRIPGHILDKQVVPLSQVTGNIGQTPEKGCCCCMGFLHCNLSGKKIVTCILFKKSNILTQPSDDTNPCLDAENRDHVANTFQS